MEHKKNPQVDLRRRYPLHLAMGFAISLVMVISAFEWTSLVPTPVIDLEYQNEPDPILSNELLPPVVRKQNPQPPTNKKPPRDQQIIEIISEPTIEDLDPLVIPEVPDEPKIPEIPPEQVDVYEPVNVDQQALPHNGWEGFQKFLRKHLKYPRQARRAEIEGTVYVHFVVDKNGLITEVEVIKGIGFGCDLEAERVISLLPAWTPARRGGLRVPVRMVLPIHFKLQ